MWVSISDIIEKGSKNEERVWERMRNGLLYEDLENMVRDLIIQSDYMKKMNVRLREVVNEVELKKMDGMYKLFKNSENDEDVNKDNSSILDLYERLYGVEIYKINGRYILLKGDRTMNDIMKNFACDNEGLRVKEYFDRKEKYNALLW
jgi:hypothetical protein